MERGDSTAWWLLNPPCSPKRLISSACRSRPLQPCASAMSGRRSAAPIPSREQQSRRNSVAVDGQFHSPGWLWDRPDRGRSWEKVSKLGLARMNAR